MVELTLHPGYHDQLEAQPDNGQGPPPEASIGERGEASPERQADHDTQEHRPEDDQHVDRLRASPAGCEGSVRRWRLTTIAFSDMG